MTFSNKNINFYSNPMAQMTIFPSQSFYCYGNFSSVAAPPQLPNKHRKKFSPEEDEILTEMVDKLGPKNWNRIAQFLPYRTARQCRDRYCNYLAPGFFNGEWLKEEDDLLYEKYKEIGPKWVQINSFFKNRSPNSLKNRWNYFVSRMYPQIQSPDQPLNEFKTQSPIQKVKEDNHSKKNKIILPSLNPLNNSLSSINFNSDKDIININNMKEIKPQENFIIINIKIGNE
ncbi:hypothetical protein M9Y10_040715 [Tritrichomonas musculus]|uniref:Myb-like DNA-binding domain containing protein n=1 Tax=Tritrichomonas musculus TaxID=1915356 RepID=A0ABR2K2C8_9EUKA